MKGSLFNPDGQKVAAETFYRRITGDQVNGCGAYVDPAPRVARAKAAGVPMVYED
ncbi:hypothetical protein [Cohaesibacter sp. ES.047]|uniref:hypothetical protein n=1 Tax=Cohaesibacter sp. ES.047 TaxID=1798205 RepID=UPI0015601D11|nr:hypothetical protein [Cohaesibacter sp. ES.047]